MKNSKEGNLIDEQRISFVNKKKNEWGETKSSFVDLSKATPTNQTKLPNNIRSKIDTIQPIVQIGFRFDPNGSVREKNYYVTGFDNKGKPRYKEELDRFDNIWAEYVKQREKMDFENNSRHIFLILRGQRIEGIGKEFRYISGNLSSDVFAVKKSNSKNLNVFYSFNERSEKVFTIISNSLDRNGNRRVVGFNGKANILAYNSQINLENLNNVDDLKAEIKNRLENRR